MPGPAPRRVPPTIRDDIPPRADRSSRSQPLDNRALANLCGPLDANLRQIEAALRRHDRATAAARSRSRRAAARRSARRRGAASASTRPPKSRCRSTTSSSAWSRSRAPRRGAGAGRRGRRRPHLRTRRADLHGRTPQPGRVPEGHPGARHHLRHRPGRHRQDLPRRRLRRRRARARRGQAHRPGAPRGRGRRAAGLPARRPRAEGRPVPAPALRRALRPDGLRQGGQALRAADDRDRAARLHARAHAQPLLHHPRRGAEHHARADEDVPHAHRLRHQGGDHRRRHADRPRARAEVRAGRGRSACWPACAASRSRASPAPTSCATRWCRRSSTPTSATTVPATRTARG